jgi:DNA-binding transcriptional MerR regulator
VYVGITEASRQVGRSIKTLRRWERERLVVPLKDAEGKRMYSEDDIAQCKHIALHSRTAMHKSRKLVSLIPEQLSLFQDVT